MTSISFWTTLAFLDPQKRDFNLDLQLSDSRGDGARFLKLGFDIGEIDFIVARALTKSPVLDASADGRRTLLDSVPEIIAKKIYYRGTMLAPRDIFDIAAASSDYAAAIVNELSYYRAETAGALATLRRQNPDFVKRAISQLRIQDRYKAIADQALGTAEALLDAVS